jgi:outer membrane protein TolC
MLSPLSRLVAVLMAVSVIATAHAAPPPRKASGPAAPVAADGPRIELTLADAVSLALRDNRTIKSAYLKRIAQKFDLRVAEDRFSPRLTLSSAYIASRANGVSANTADVTPIVTMSTPTGALLALSAPNSYNTGGGGGLNASSSLNFTVIQPLLRGGGTEAAMAPVRIARIDEKIDRLTLKQTVSRTVSEVVLAYREFLKGQEQLHIAEEALKRSRALLVVNRALIDAGRMAEIDIVQAEADVATQEFSVEDAANQLDAARLALLAALAVSPRTDIRTVDSLTAEQMHIDLDRALAIAFENQPEYLVQILTIERSKMAVAVAKNQRLWDLSAVGGANVGRSRDTWGRNRDTGSYGGLQLVVPLGDLSQEQGEVTATVAQRDAELKLEAVRQQVEQNTRDSVRNVRIRWRQLELARKARDLAARKLEVEGEKLRVGRSSNFQVLSFENDLRNADNARLGALIAYLNALTILDQQLGTTLDTWQIALED